SVIPAGGFLVFYGTNSFGINGANSFSLDAAGDQVYLFSGDGQALTGYAHGFNFGAAPSGVTFGRYVLSTGAEDFVLQITNTLGRQNAGPLVGPIVISEINYHPPDISLSGISINFRDQFIELQNISAEPVPLYDTANPSHTWQLRNAVDYE